MKTREMDSLPETSEYKIIKITSISIGLMPAKKVISTNRMATIKLA